MKGRLTRTTSRTRTRGRTDFERLRAMRDADIDNSDIPRLGKSFWKAAKLTMPEPKDRLTIRIDHDVVECSQEKGQRLSDTHQRYFALLHAQSGEGKDRRT